MTLSIPAELIERLSQAKRMVVMTGAGISAESGIPTFRDAQTGLWAQYKPEELASEAGFRAAPERVWQWYAWRRQQVLKTSPNPGHYALAQLQQRLPGFTLITQNVDGLHQAAGSTDVIELHGSIRRVRCLDNDCGEQEWPEDHSDTPLRHSCGSLLRPAVVWFGEYLPEQALAAAIEAVEHCDLMFSIGTSSLVYPAAELPLLAKRHGATVVEINPNPTPLSPRADYVLNGAAGVVLPQIVAALDR